MLSYNETPVQQIHEPFLDKAGVRLLIKREDLNHPHVSGNKWWKLLYNLEACKREGKDTLLTFGGAYSNHIYATAAAAQACNLESIGLIRGEETLPLNPTLQFANACGMKLRYVTREDYRRKKEPLMLQKLVQPFGNCYVIPEGGSNQLAVQGVMEFSQHLRPLDFQYLCTPVGTGGTLAGLIAGFNGDRTILGFSVLKGGDFLKEEVKTLLPTTITYSNWRLETAYHFGGYAKTTKELLGFLEVFHQTHGFRLDPIYTGKMMWGIFDLIKQGTFPRGTTILAIHTGGPQFPGT